jgi:hypothetical protein
VGGGHSVDKVSYSEPGSVGGWLGILQQWFLGQQCNSVYMSSKDETQQPDSRVFGMCSVD